MSSRYSEYSVGLELFSSPSFQMELSRRPLLVDSGPLIAAFHMGDPRHIDAKVFLVEFWEGEVLVPVSVLVETWGMLTRRDKRGFGKRDLLEWLMNPGTSGTLIPQHAKNEQFIFELHSIKGLEIDCVDALLINYAETILGQIEISPMIFIATYDSHFTTLRTKYKFRFKIVNEDRLDELYDL